MIYNVLEYGIINDKNTLSQKALQQLINDLPDGGTIYFPKGEYLLSTVYLKSNITIELAKGTVIYGSKNFDDYDFDEPVDYPLYQDQSHSFFNCSLFVGKEINNICFKGKGIIDMQSCWDLENKRDIKHRGPKALAFRTINNLVVQDITINYCTDLALYFTNCTDVEIHHVKMDTYIDGISPDNCKNVHIHDCNIIAGDDGIVFKSSYNMNRLDFNKNILVERCIIKSNCNAIKFGTESNGGFYDITIKDCYFYETRITGFSIESVDGGHFDNIKIKNIMMKNVGTAFFVFLGKRLRGPEGTEIGSMKNISFENVCQKGPYKPYKPVIWNYVSYVDREDVHYPWVFGFAEGIDSACDKYSDWQFTSNCCGLVGHDLENISFKNIKLKLWGSAKEVIEEVPEETQEYPEVYVYSKHLPCYGMYFRHINGLTIKNFKVKTINKDVRKKFAFTDIKNILKDF